MCTPTLSALCWHVPLSPPRAVSLLIWHTSKRVLTQVTIGSFTGKLAVWTATLSSLTHQALSCSVKSSLLLVSMWSLPTRPYSCVSHYNDILLLVSSFMLQLLYSFWLFSKVPCLHQGFSQKSVSRYSVCPTSLSSLFLPYARMKTSNANGMFLALGKGFSPDFLVDNNVYSQCF